MNCKKLLLAGVAVIAFIIFLPHTHAATLYFSPDTVNAGIGNNFTVDLKIDSQDTLVNAVQTTVKFPTGILKLLSFDKAGSAFNFWLKDPVISNSDGTVTFIAGTDKGVSGAAIQVLALNFSTIGAGTAQIAAVDANVVAADGNGTNVLSTIKNANVGVGTNIISTAAQAPQAVNRPAVTAIQVPATPVFTVPLYPDQSRWYSQVGNVMALWDLPADITQISARITQKKESTIGTPESSLLTGKDFGVLKEGTWYVRVQFKNNIGWSQPAYYKISLDTTPPLPFNIKISSTVSDDPSPSISFETQDSLSGILQYAVLVDGNEILRTASTTLNLPPQASGQHTLLVRAYDMAGNSVEDSLPFQILPLQTPTITYFSNSVMEGEQIFISGKTSATYSVELTLLDSQNQKTFSTVVKSDSVGNWQTVINAPLSQGNYSLLAVAKDDRGATSYPTAASQIKIRAKPLFSIGIFDIGWFEILLLALAAAGFIVWRYILRKRMQSAYRVIAGRDVKKMSVLLEEQIEALEKWGKRQEFINGRDKNEFDYISQKMKDIVVKMAKYLGEELEKIK